MAENDGIVGVANEEIRKFRPRSIGGGSTLLLLLATVCFAGWIFSLVTKSSLSNFSLFQGIVKIVTAYSSTLMILGSVFLIMAVISVVFDKLRRCPPPSWMIVDELKSYLFNESLLPEDVTLWKSYLKIRRPKFDRNASCVTIWFYVRAAKATEDSFLKVKEGQAFRYAQDVEIAKHIDKRGRWDGYDLRIWYRPEEDVFNKLIEKVRP